MKTLSRSCLFLVLSSACGNAVPTTASAPCPTLASPISAAPTASSSTTPIASATSSAAPNGLPPIVQAGEPVLRSRARELSPEEARSPETRALIERMIATMRAAPGVGLAAPQIGVPLRIIVLEDRPELLAKLNETEIRERERRPFGPRVFINPVLKTIGADKATFFEGCLSVRGYTGLVERALEVEVTGLDEEGKPVTWQVHGWPARILQHETDHINGTLYIDKMRSRSFTQADLAKSRFGGKPIAEILKLVGD